jgi:hypothetical protein
MAFSPPAILEALRPPDVIDIVFRFSAAYWPIGGEWTAEPGAPPPDGSVGLQTTAIAPGQGVTWGDCRLRFHNQTFTFVLSTKTRADPSVLSSQFAGEQVIAEGAVYHLSQVSDFAGTYVRITPEEVHGRGSADLTFQNEHGVILHLSRIQKTRAGLDVQFAGERLTIEGQ